jgi:hypothetical protein
MQPSSYARHQFPAEIIQHATWLYLRFTLSYRDVEELLAERGIESSYETVRRWVVKFGPKFAHRVGHGGCPEAHAQTAEDAGLCTRHARDRQARLLQSSQTRAASLVPP